jgi:1-phosphofructokinase family hexose kinase
MINTVTFNAAVDHILFLEKMIKNITNRVTGTLVSVGGKGTHVSINLSIMGKRSRAFGFAYGKNGRYIIEQLKKFDVETHFCYADDRESRDCYQIIEKDSSCTMFAEKGVSPHDIEIELMFEEMKNHIESNDMLVLSGDASNTRQGTYLRIMEELAGKDVRIFLDTSGEMLKEGIKKHPYLIKPNKDELASLCGVSIENNDDVLSAIDSLDKYGIEVIAVSLGSIGSVMRTSKGTFIATPPEVKIRNTIGCGDCFLSGLIFGIEKKMDEAETLAWATAVSSSAATTPLSVGFDLDFATNLLCSCKVKKI